jgi:hypothetical protein
MSQLDLCPTNYLLPSHVLYGKEGAIRVYQGIPVGIFHWEDTLE